MKNKPKASGQNVYVTKQHFNLKNVLECSSKFIWFHILYYTPLIITAYDKQKCTVNYLRHYTEVLRGVLIALLRN